MQDLELYRRILGTENPWYVKSVDLKLEAGEVHVHLAHKPVNDWASLECGRQCRLYDHQPERHWRHLDTCQYQTIVHAEPPRSQCSEHEVKVVKLPWADPSSRLTPIARLYWRNGSTPRRGRGDLLAARVQGAILFRGRRGEGINRGLRARLRRPFTSPIAAYLQPQLVPATGLRHSEERGDE